MFSGSGTRKLGRKLQHCCTAFAETKPVTFTALYRYPYSYSLDYLGSSRLQGIALRLSLDWIGIPRFWNLAVRHSLTRETKSEPTNPIARGCGRLNYHLLTLYVACADGGADSLGTVLYSFMRTCHKVKRDHRP